MASTSAREKRLWILALICQMGIYASLGYMRGISNWLRDHGLLRLTVGLLFSIAVLGIGWMVARRRPALGELLVLLGFGVLTAGLLVRVRQVEERVHLLEYGVVGGLIYAALRERHDNLRRSGGRPGWLNRAPAPIAMLITGLLGWGDEGIQAVLPERYYDLRDAGLNVLAGVVVISAMVTLRWLRDRRSSTESA